MFTLSPVDVTRGKKIRPVRQGWILMGEPRVGATSRRCHPRDRKEWKLEVRGGRAASYPLGAMDPRLLRLSRGSQPFLSTGRPRASEAQLLPRFKAPEQSVELRGFHRPRSRA
jgi:hypothetical protein